LTAINSLTQSVGQIEGKLDGIVTQLHDNVAKTAKISEDLHALNKKIAYAAGVLAVVVAIAGFVIYTTVNLAISFAKEAIHSYAQSPKSPPAIEQPQPAVPKLPNRPKP
jgi:hypothetical protein